MVTLIDDLFGGDVRCAEAIPELADNAMYPEEYEYIRRAVPSRRAEFATARLLARQELVAMGLAPSPFVPGRGGAPKWPDGVVGSISHTNDYCAIVVARIGRLCSLGLDIETLRPLDPLLHTSILTKREQAWIGNQAKLSKNDCTLLFFSAKEAFYKCQYPLSGGFLDFPEVELEVSLDAARFEVRVLVPGWPASVARLDGKFAIRSGKVMCGVEALA